MQVLQALLGHKTATLTLDRYGHLFPDDLGRIVDEFDAAAKATADETNKHDGAIKTELSVTSTFSVPPVGLEPTLCGF